MPVRAMKSKDLPQVHLLAQQLGYKIDLNSREKTFQNLKESADHIFLIEEDEHQTLRGWIHGRLNPSLLHTLEGEIEGLVVDEACRHQGIGTQLLEHLQVICKERNWPTLCVRSRVEREAAHAFYKKMGFAQIKTQHVYRKSE